MMMTHLANKKQKANKGLQKTYGITKVKVQEDGLKLNCTGWKREGQEGMMTVSQEAFVKTKERDKHLHTIVIGEEKECGEAIGKDANFTMTVD